MVRGPVLRHRAFGQQVDARVFGAVEIAFALPTAQARESRFLFLAGASVGFPHNRFITLAGGLPFPPGCQGLKPCDERFETLSFLRWTLHKVVPR